MNGGTSGISGWAKTTYTKLDIGFVKYFLMSSGVSAKNVFGMGIPFWFSGRTRPTS